MGIPADQETKNARRAAHEQLDIYQKAFNLTRNGVYRHLQRLMGLSKAKAHIGLFNKEQCEKLILILKEKVHDLQADFR